MIFGSVCSGIEAASVAWKPLGWRCAFMSEIEAFPRAVLRHHYPETPLHGDFTTIQTGEYEPIDLLVGGTPCQSFSVAGLRGGLADDRGNLALEYLRLADRLRPRWLVWENVPGVLSSAGGRDFGSILGGMGELGYGWAFRVLDAQFFGVAQRRRRVFVVGHLGDWRRASAVLFERDCLSGNPAPSREAGPGVAALTANGVGTCGAADDNQGQAGHLIASALAPPLTHNPYGDHESREALLVAATLTRTYAEQSGQDMAQDGLLVVTHALRGEGFDASEDGTGRGTPIVPVAFMSNASGANLSFGHDQSPTLRIGGGGGNAMAVAFNITPSNSNKDYNARPSDRAQAVTAGGNRPSARGGDLIAQGVTIHGTDKTASTASLTDVAGSVRTKPPGSVENSSTTAALHGSAVRRLTPRECERLQGFPDDYTLIPWRKGQAPDGPRYKALGNSMAVPVMAWIGQRIAAVEALPGAPSCYRMEKGDE